MDRSLNIAKPRLWILASLCALAALIWGANWYLLARSFADDPAKQGQFGDMFGAANALFTALAFAGLAYTVLLQRYQLALQQQEISNSAELQRQLFEKQITAQTNLSERQQVFQEALRQKQEVHELKMEDLRQRFEEIIEGKRKDRENQTNTEFAKNVLRAIQCELEALDELYSSGIGKDLEAVPDGGHLGVRFAMTENFYTVYRANAVHLGKLTPQVAKQIVKVYALIKAQVENLRINNTMLDELDMLREKRMSTLPGALSPDLHEGLAGRVQAGQFAARRDRIQSLLVDHLKRLRRNELTMKREYSTLCGLLSKLT